MTATISIPQKLYDQVTEAAQVMDVSEGRLVAWAVIEYLDNQKAIRGGAAEKYTRDGFDMRIEAAGVESIRELTKNNTW